MCAKFWISWPGRFAVTSRCRGTDHQEVGFGRPRIGELVSHTGWLGNTATRLEHRRAVLGAHLCLASEQVEELAGMPVPVPLFARASRYTLLNHGKVGAGE
jgi:hypothetical protein